MIATQNEHLIRVFNFISEEEADGLDALPASVHIVSQEKIATFGREASILEQPKHIVVLTMDISTHLDWSRDLD